MTKYEQAVESINRSYQNKDITKAERDEKLKKAEKFKEPNEKPELKKEAKVLKNKTGTKAVNIKTDATGQLRAFYVQIYNGEEQVLESKDFSNIEKAEEWANKKLNDSPEPKKEESKPKESKNNKIVKDFLTGSEASFEKVVTHPRIDQVLEVIRLEYAISPKTDLQIIKVGNQILFEKEGEILPDFKALETSKGYEVYSLKTESVNKLEKSLREPQKESKPEPKEKPKAQKAKGTGNALIDDCKDKIKVFQQEQKEKKAEIVRKELIAQASTPEKKQEIEEMTVSEVLQKANPKPRIDVLSKERIKALAKQNISNRLKKLAKKEQIEVSEEDLDEISEKTYNVLDEQIDRLFKK
ncbi:MAG: hypothetical protein MUC49_02240 [Raineya sp.]|jgi:hypothetical protein|nr:hypothetical protein [Raineya sp.]